MSDIIPKVIEVSTLSEWRIRVAFQVHGVVVVDMKPHLEFGVFRKLQDVALFKQVRVSFGTVEWPGGIDLDPEWLLRNGVKEMLVAEPGMPYEG